MTTQSEAVALYQRGRFADARDMTLRLLDERPADSALHNIAGACARALGDLAAAETHWRAATSLQPSLSDGHNNLGVLLHETGRPADAEASFRAALSVMPSNAGAHYNLARVMTDLGRVTEAEGHYRQALGLQPQYVDAWTGLGLLLLDLNRFADAEAALRRATELAAQQPNAHYNLGNALLRQGRNDDARVPLLRALALDPNHIGALTNMANAARQQGNFAEAERHFQRAIAASPQFAPLHWSLGAVLHEQGRPAEAEQAYRRAIDLGPDEADSHTNLGALLRDVGRLDHAEAALRRAVALDPGHSGARVNLAMLLLSTGRYHEGWANYEARSEARFGDRTFVPPDLPYPQWRGEPLGGKSILVLREQGIGDEIQCARFVQVLRALGARTITLMTRGALLDLFSQLGADRMITEGDVTLEPHDYWAFSFGIAAVICTSESAIPATIPYLRASPNRVAAWKPRLQDQRLKVGIVWKGGTLHRNDRFRSLPGIDSLAPILAIPSVAFFSLQKGTDETAASTASHVIANIGPELHDFADTAAVVAQLDLVITVDTAVAHLAGALGTKVWVMVPAINTDWRWLVGREDSPWYSDVMRVFRQTAAGDWSNVITQIAAELAALSRRDVS